MQVCVQTVKSPKYAALNETVNTKHGMKVELNNIADAAITLLKDTEDRERRSKMLKKWARKEFDIDTLAKEWDIFFNED